MGFILLAIAGVILAFCAIGAILINDRDED